MREEKMNPLHLLWIIPLAGAAGLLWGLLLAAAGRYDREDEK